MCIKFLTCRSVDGVEVLRADPAVVCYTAGHTVAMVTALIVLVLTGVIVPLTVSFFNVLSVYGDGDGEDPDSEPELCKYQPPMPAEPATGGKRFESRNRQCVLIVCGVRCAQAPGVACHTSSTTCPDWCKRELSVHW